MARRVLIIGQTFQPDNGGGITLTNLFGEWPAKDLAVAGSHKSIVKSQPQYCNNLYVLGQEELWTIWPLNYLTRKYTSGHLGAGSPVTGSIRNTNKWLINLKSRMVFSLLWLLHKSGLYHLSFRINISKKFLDWFDEFGPDIVYTQLSTLELIIFLRELKKIRQFKLVIHMMDDWPSTIVKSGIASYYWKKKIHNELSTLIKDCDLFLTISDSMKKEYFLRYAKNAHAFHNPVNLELYEVPAKNEKDHTRFRILYTGRIGTANEQSLMLFSKVLGKGKFEEKAELHIYSPDSYKLKPLFNGKRNIYIHGPVDHNSIPRLLMEHDLLLLPLDFSPVGIKFARYSMPTKATEYMASGTPVMVLASPQTAVAKHALEHKWGYLVGEPSEKIIAEAIEVLCENAPLRREIGQRAREFAFENFNKMIITSRFFNLLNEI